MDAGRIVALHHNNRLQITASFGVAAYPEHGNNPETLLAAADIALYKAKEKGRNKVVRHSG